MSAEAREAVARALNAMPADARPSELVNRDRADRALAALQPIIAAEIRAWAEAGHAPGGNIHWLVEELGAPETAAGAAIALNNLTASADAIASRICDTRQEHTSE